MGNFHSMLEEERRVERADMINALASPLWPKAVAFLKDDLAPVAAKTRERIAACSAGHQWIIPYHFHWGMSVRNRLRDAGFGEQAFGIVNLDNVYVALIEAAVKEGA